MKLAIKFLLKKAICAYTFELIQKKSLTDVVSVVQVSPPLAIEMITKEGI